MNTLKFVKETKSLKQLLDTKFERETDLYSDEWISNVVDGVLFGIPMQRVVLLRTDKDSETYEIITSLDKFNALQDFVEDRVPLNPEGLYFNKQDLQNKKFSELSDEVKEKLLNTEIDVVKIDEYAGISTNTLADVFEYL